MTARWVTGLRFEDIATADFGEKWARLTSPLRYVSSSDRLFVVPAGFATDFASIPRLLWTLVGSPAAGRYRRAAVLHDYLYAQADTVGVSRKEADRVFLEAMMVSGVHPARAKTLYYGVRIGGWVAWDNYREGRRETR